MATIHNPAVPPGSTVLVTGVNGFLGSHIADQFLRNGYKVRGTVRDPIKEAWALDIFSRLYGKDKFELVGVPEMELEGAYDEAAKGVDVFAHSAAFMSFVSEADKVIPVTVAGAVNALKAAYAEPTVKRFVLTSSSAAAVGVLDSGVTVTEESWNVKAVERAWSGPPFEQERPLIVYEASKTESEQAIWKFHRENRSKRPDLIVNAVLPNFIVGRTVDPVGQGFRSSCGMVASLWKGKVTPFHPAVPRQYYVDVEDTAVLHVAAALLTRIQDQRIFAFGGRFSWDAILDAMRRLDPERNLPDNFSGGEDPNEIEPRQKAEELLQELGRPGWTSLKNSIAANIKGVELKELQTGGNRKHNL
ncbi:uncharacterized protein A1O9_00881 [Exophiala aquamarina CBS 119918]|uniref:NAD-dependent epimerase/dehydratase domain-containing protein n=1 Tax=Exophiala aquamarina CBS 119918 TaxID=1182545 RepID=A0A072PT39_9EURO|nr:uncharacterized protein A1O9_00881 [Exophiala aquamarina CBS 119918]KEF62907.1 hypothetical protein A1O9_00881 [Exophiala aquamarina CBS 119918]